ncbi:MAG TPA: DUF389 domain-containing protein [Gemmatimonadaceae bacterium]|nr:DUF389 domain-containing protein [Gemmatimonadaceae bacterium]
MPGLLPRVLVYSRRLFSLRDDADEELTIAEIKASVDFRGGNLWALVLAIVVASVGLNVNSTAVIIGAMLISPLMGPIMGAGLGLGLNDVELLRRSVRNILIAALASIATSTLYFSLSPLAEAQSELLARTRPTIYDVLIALAGGTAGIVAITRRGARGNVIPGVAIATALMPPLCTAGYGLAQGQYAFFFGALYLFVINSLFICLATLGIVRLLDFKRVVDLDPVHARRMRILITVATALAVIPSGFVAWRVVVETRYEAAARRYIAENLTIRDHTIVNTSVRHGRDSSTIEATLLGRPIPLETMDVLRQRLDNYGLARTRLIVHQPDEGQVAPEQLGQMVRTGILEDLYKRNEAALEARDAKIRVLENEVLRLRAGERPIGEVASELATLFPSLRSLLYGRAVSVANVSSSVDSLRTVLATWRRLPSSSERVRIQRFLEERLDLDSLQVFHLPGR